MVIEILTPTCSSTSRRVQSSLGSSSVRPSRGRNDVSGAAASYTGTRLAAVATTTSQEKALESVVEALRYGGLPGPILVVDREYLGQGAQFVVYKGLASAPEHMNIPRTEIAIKQPKFDLDPDMRLDFSDSEAKKHMHDMYLEIFALTDPALRVHPNIARLLAWSTNIFSFHQPLTLLMELAESDLARLLADDGVQVSSSGKYSICHDIAAGLDALHDCRLVHSDLKPENVLIFRHKGRIVAKLADFGLSIDEAKSDHTRTHLGGTPGWQAPQVEVGSMLYSDGLLQTDNYSFGLLVWSTMLHSGKVPPMPGKEARQATARREFENAKEIIGLDNHPALADAVQNLLEYDPYRRPLRVADLLADRPQDEELA
jgi:serine/threonine protein kinase